MLEISCQMAGLGGLVFAASLFGILTRPVGFLAAFWPANAILLGVMVRYPVLASAWGWIAAIVGYLAADFLTGGGVLMTLWLTTGNLAGAATGVFLFLRLTDEDRHLRRPLSVLYLFSICAATGIAAALVGGGVGPVLFGKDWLTGFAFWFITELVNSILLIPVILTAPRRSELRATIHQLADAVQQTPIILGPLLALLISMAASVLIGGPGAIVFSVPALLWCALRYNLFSTALLTLLYCAWMMMAVSAGNLVIHPVSDYINETMSIRLGICLLALGPLTAASINAAREELLRSLDHAVNHDYLTNALARRAFMRHGAVLIEKNPNQQLLPAVLMMDIDHFKSVNDRYGHTAGDHVLVSFASIITKHLREKDLFGRLGGEEFAVILPQVAAADALMIAERLRSKIEMTPILMPNGDTLRITVSIGVAYPAESCTPPLETLLHEADQALYQSKHEGRNRITGVQVERIEQLAAIES
ncbi:MAG: diguanylate cyclase [Planctomycetota bacterium]